MGAGCTVLKVGLRVRKDLDYISKKALQSLKRVVVVIKVVEYSAGAFQAFLQEVDFEQIFEDSVVFELADFRTEVLLFNAETDRVKLSSVFISIPFVEMGYVLSQRRWVHARCEVEDARNEEDRPDEVAPYVD